MWRCIICRFEVELDDMIARPVGTRCVCLRCYLRQTDNEKQMPAELRRELIEATKVQ